MFTSSPYSHKRSTHTRCLPIYAIVGSNTFGTLASCMAGPNYCGTFSTFLPAFSILVAECGVLFPSIYANRTGSADLFVDITAITFVIPVPAAYNASKTDPTVVCTKTRDYFSNLPQKCRHTTTVALSHWRMALLAASGPPYVAIMVERVETSWGFSSLSVSCFEKMEDCEVIADISFWWVQFSWQSLS